MRASDEEGIKEKISTAKNAIEYYENEIKNLRGTIFAWEADIEKLRESLKPPKDKLIGKLMHNMWDVVNHSDEEKVFKEKERVLLADMKKALEKEELTKDDLNRIYDRLQMKMLTDTNDKHSTKGRERVSGLQEELKKLCKADD